MSIILDGTTYTKFPEGEDRNLFFSNYYTNPDSQNITFYYIAPGSASLVLLGKYADNNTIRKNENDVYQWASFYV